LPRGEHINPSSYADDHRAQNGQKPIQLGEIDGLFHGLHRGYPGEQAQKSVTIFVTPVSRTFEEIVGEIEKLAKLGWRLGLDRMKAFVDYAGLTESLGVGNPPSYIQIAGTNGKGTATAALQSILVAQGHRTGGYFSPYVYDFRERIQINGELIRKERFCDLAERLLERASSFGESKYGPVTEFEFKTALGIAAFAAERCDWVALEVGIGGRLDATTVVTPRAGIITSIGLDHVHILGNTHAEIAREKAGILKLGMPLALGRMDPSAEHVIRECARENGSEVWQLGQEIELSETSGVYTLRLPSGREIGPWKSPLVGRLQADNIALAVAAAELAGAIADPSKVVSGVETTRIAGRFEQRDWEGVPVILDGAHNGEAAEALAESLADAGFAEVMLVTTMLQGHEVERFYSPLRSHIEKAFCVELNMPRARKVGDLANALSNLSIDVEPYPSVEDAMHDARKAWKPGQAILVTGSFYLVGEVGNWLSGTSRQ